MNKSKKKIIYPIVFVVLIVLTIYAVVSQSASFTAEGFVEYIANAKSGWLILSIACMLSFIINEGLALLVLCRAAGSPQRFHSGLMYSAADIYFSAITPSATGGQPASAVCMIRDGISGVNTTLILLVNLALYTASILVIGLFCFAVRPSAFLCFGGVAKALIVVGLTIQIILFSGIVLLVLNGKLFSKIAHFFWRVGRKLRLVRNMESREAKLARIEGDYRACVELMRGHTGAIVSAFALNVLQRVSSILVTAFVFMAAGGSAAKILDLFCVQGMVVMGSTCVPLPGSVGVADYLALDGLGAFVADPVNLELLARCVSFYACILLCGIALLISFLLRKKKNRGTKE